MELIHGETLYLMGCRGFDQFCCTVRSLVEPEAFCPFCAKELSRRGRKPDETAGDWHLIKNEFPHRNVLQMWLIVPSAHITGIRRLGPQDWISIGKLVTLCLGKHSISGGGIMARFGDPHLNAGTVEHLHFNIIEPVCGKEYRAPLAKQLAEHAEDYQRLLGFRDQLVERGGMEWLMSPAGIDETQPKIS